jgi:hypothetical protein
MNNADKLQLSIFNDNCLLPKQSYSIAFSLRTNVYTLLRIIRFESLNLIKHIFEGVSKHSYASTTSGPNKTITAFPLFPYTFPNANEGLHFYNLRNSAIKLYDLL